ncbi:monocarboxylate transporter 2-like [Haliotis cracherodii]|uniref:monocarboxylate transporter 2-like n=1 Tax=Haliotis cracherodii TaxID=6455 RepID=UPI0039EA0853
MAKTSAFDQRYYFSIYRWLIQVPLAKGISFLYTDGLYKCLWPKVLLFYIQMAYTSDIDHGYAWVALMATFSIQFIIGVISYSTGVINIAIMEEVEDDITKTSWIGSTLFGTYTLLGPIAGVVQQKVGARITAMAGGLLMLLGMSVASFCQTVIGLLLTYGLIAGVGLGLGANVIGVIPGQYFRKRRPAAYGICMAGCGAGLFVGGPLSQYLLHYYKLHGTLLIMGGIGFNMCVAGALLRPVNPDGTCRLENVEELETQKCIVLKTSENDDQMITSQFDERSFCLVKDVQMRDMEAIECSQEQPICKRFHIFRQFPFWMYSLSIMLWSLGEAAWIFHLPNYAEQKGRSPAEAASLLTAMGAGSMFSRVFAGIAASDSNIDAVVLQVGLSGLAGIISFLFTVGPFTYGSLLARSYLYGTYSHGINSLIGPIIINLLGLPHVAVAFGIVCFFCGLGNLLGPPIASTLYKRSGIYEYTYVFAGACLILGSISTALTNICRLRKSMQCK